MKNHYKSRDVSIGNRITDSFNELPYNNALLKRDLMETDRKSINGSMNGSVSERNRNINPRRF